MVNFTSEVLGTLELGHDGVAARSNSGNEAVEAAVGRVIDDPALLFVEICFVHFEVEASAFLEAVAVPELADLGDDLVTIGISALPLDGRVEAVH